MSTVAQHYFAGPVKVEWAPRDPSDGSLEPAVELGINREAIPMIITPKFLDVPSDDWGGPDGVPSDAQFMGATAQIQLSLTKTVVANADAMLDGLAYLGKTAGTFTEPIGAFIRTYWMGQLILNGNVISPATGRKSVTFPRCFVRGGGVVGHGTRYASYDFQIEAWLDGYQTRQLYAITYH